MSTNKNDQTAKKNLASSENNQDKYINFNDYKRKASQTKPNPVPTGKMRDKATDEAYLLAI